MAQNRNLALLSYLLFMALGTFTAMVDQVTITLKNNESVTLDAETFAKLKKGSQTIKNMIEDSGTQMDLLLNEISTKDFNQVVTFLKNTDLPKAQKKFWEKKKSDELYSLANVANFLDISQLLDAVLDQIAERISTIVEKKDIKKNESLFDIPLAPDLQKLLIKKLVRLADSLVSKVSEKTIITSKSLIENFKFDRLQLATINQKYASFETTSGSVHLFNLKEKEEKIVNLRHTIDLINVSPNAYIITLIRSNGEIQTFDDRTGKKIANMNITPNKDIVARNAHLVDAIFLDIASDEQKNAIAVVVSDSTVHVFTLDDKQSYILNLKDKIAYCVSFHPEKNKTIVAIGLRDGSVTFWDYIAGTQAFHKPLNALIKKVLFSNNGSIFFAGDYAGNIVAYEPGTRNILNTFSIEKNLVTMALSADGKYLAVADHDNYCTIIRTETLSPVYKFRLSKNLAIWGISFSPNGDQIFSAQQLYLKKSIPPFQQWSLSEFKKIEESILKLNFQQLLLFLLVREQGFKIIEKNKTLWEPIYNSLSDEQKELLALLKK